MDFISRDFDPTPCNEHPNGISRHSKHRRPTIPIRAAACAVRVREMTVDVVGCERIGGKPESPYRAEKARWWFALQPRAGRLQPFVAVVADQLRGPEALRDVVFHCNPDRIP